MPTKREREYYIAGYRAAMGEMQTLKDVFPGVQPTQFIPDIPTRGKVERFGDPFAKPKRKLSAWNKFVKANSKKPRFRYRNGKLNLKKMAVAFRKTPAGRKKKRR